MKISNCVISFLIVGLTSLHAQYHPSKLFKPDFYKHKGNAMRSASGQPGPAYWQNEADYTIKASFDVDTHLLDGTVQIDYTNNSPDDLDYLWLELDQNESRDDAKRMQMRRPDEPDNTDKQGFTIDDVKLAYGNQKTKDADFKVLGTRMQVFLEEPLQAGDSIQLTIPYSYTLPKEGNRSGYMENEAGSIYNFTYWYPRMRVYDDYYGWNTLAFIGGGEMYLDYGDIDYKLTVPADQLVVGAGYLANKADVLTDKFLKRLDKAAHSDETVLIRKADELDEPVTKGNSDTVTWHFKMDNTRDVAWTMSRDYMWDAAKINLSEGKTALAQSVYPEASIKEGRPWARSTQMLKHSVEYFSDYIIDFPYKVATNAAGSVFGMEYPGFTTNGWDVSEYDMYLLAQHEIGHTWFPMIVGSDERKNAFLDEGLNVFVDVYAQEDFNDGEFAPKRDGEYAPDGGNPADEIISVIDSARADKATLMMRPDDMDYKHVHPLSYFKASFGLVLLREVILDHDRFDYALRQYAKNWAYKHPRPENFFRSMDNATGEDLTWFWNGWFYHNWQLDQAIETVDYVEDNPKNGALITVKNNRQMAMPILVHIETENGETQDLKIPVDVWKFGDTTQFKVDTEAKLKRVVLDKEHQLPDTDRSNNTWESSS